MDSVAEYRLVVASRGLRRLVIELLEENNLPVIDLDSDKDLFALMQEDTVIGSGGLEFLEECALLRSVSVKQDFRGKGLGKFITTQLEEISRHKGIVSVYLLTNTAKDFFAKEGYTEIRREDAPSSIQNTSEFSSVCPSSATVMRKMLR